MTLLWGNYVSISSVQVFGFCSKEGWAVKGSICIFMCINKLVHQVLIYGGVFFSTYCYVRSTSIKGLLFLSHMHGFF
jgi:hypothetical protein